MQTSSIDSNRNSQPVLLSRNNQSTNDKSIRTEDSKASLFETLLALPIFDSKLEVPAKKSEPTKSETSENTSPVNEKEEKKDDSEGTTSVVTTPLVCPVPIEKKPEIVKTEKAAEPTSIKKEAVKSENHDVVAVKYEHHELRDVHVDKKELGKELASTDGKPTGKQPIPETKQADVKSELRSEKKIVPTQQADERGRLIEDPDLAAKLNNGERRKQDSSEQVSERQEAKSHKSHESKEVQTSPSATLQIKPELPEANVTTQETTKAKHDSDDLTDKKPKNDLAVQRSRRSERLEENRREARLDAKPSLSEDSTVVNASQISTEQTQADSQTSGDSTNLNQNSSFTVGTTPPSIAVDDSSFDAALNGGSISIAQSTPATATSAVVAASSSTTVGVNVTAGALNQENPNGVSGISSSNATRSFSSNHSNQTTGSSGTSSPLTEHQTKRLMNRVVSGMEQLKDGTNQVRLRLHPPELGSLQVTIRVENQNMSAMIEVEHTAARDALVENLSLLQKSLGDQGITVAKFDVQVVDPGQFSNTGSFTANPGFQGQGGGQQNSANAARQARYADMNRNRIDAAGPDASSNPSASKLWTRNSAMLDLTA